MTDASITNGDDLAVAAAAAVALGAQAPVDAGGTLGFMLMPNDEVLRDWSDLAAALARETKPAKCISFRWRRILIVGCWPTASQGLVARLIDAGELDDGVSGVGAVDVVVRAAGRAAPLSRAQWRLFLEAYTFPFLDSTHNPGDALGVDAKLVVDYTHKPDDDVEPIVITRS